MGATWCPDCFVGQWMCLYPFMELPTSAHLDILACLDGLSVAFLGQTSMELLQKPAPECALTPVPAFMASNGLEPKAHNGTLQVGYMGADLHPFAVRAAGLRTMIQQVVDAIRDGWALGWLGRPWVAVEGRLRLERRAAREVVALRIPLTEAASVEYFNLRWDEVFVIQGLHAHARRPSSVRVPSGYAAPTPKAAASGALPLSHALFRWGHLASPPLHLVRPPSEASTAGDLSAARLRSLAARSKASGAATALVPYPPSVPPPDALLDAARSRSSSARQDGLEEAPDY